MSSRRRSAKGAAKKNEQLDDTCIDVAGQLAEAFPQFRFVLIAIDPSNTFNPTLTFDPRLCRHELQKILAHIAAFPEIVAGEDPPRGLPS